mgnify:CR=1 FL=1
MSLRTCPQRWPASGASGRSSIWARTSSTASSTGRSGGSWAAPASTCGSALEIGYWIQADEINQGLATEVAAALTRVAFEVEQVNRVEIRCDPANVRSPAVPRKLGFIHEATLRGNVPGADGTYRDTMVWALLKSEYPESPAARCVVEAFDALGHRIL